MLVRSDEKVPIARLLAFLEYGERMAQDCAASQAKAINDVGASRFLRNQSRQEAMHASVFQGAIAWLAPRHLGDAPFLPALELYRKKLDAAFVRADLYETFLAEQIILEGLGEAPPPGSVTLLKGSLAEGLLMPAAGLTLLTKNSFLAHIRHQYVITARAKGLSEFVLFFCIEVTS